MIYLINEDFGNGHVETIHQCNNTSEVVLFLNQYINKKNRFRKGEITIKQVGL